MTIQEQNRIIADFMNYPSDNENKSPYYYAIKHCYDNDLMRYHEDWGWLMPVVEKIESIYDDHHGYFGVHIHSNCCVIQGTYLHRALDEPLYGAVYISDINALFPTKIESTYYAVVKFIQWYNTLKK